MSLGMNIELRTISFVRTDAEKPPRHWSVSDVEGTLAIDEEYSEGSETSNRASV